MTFRSENIPSAEVLHQCIAGATAHRLHETAQPLTIVMGILELALFNSCTTDEQGRSMEQKLGQALKELQRAVDGLNQARDLIRLSQPARDISTFAASRALESVLKKFEGRFEQLGVKLDLQTAGDSDDLLKASQSRISQATNLVLSNTLPLVGIGDRVHLSVEPSPDMIGIRVGIESDRASVAETSEPAGSGFNPVPQGWELAHAVVESAGGRLDLCHCPFSALISLPRQRQETTGAPNS